MNLKQVLELFDGSKSVPAIAVAAAVAPEQLAELMEELQRQDLIDLYRTPISYHERYNPEVGQIEVVKDSESLVDDFAIQGFLKRISVECDAMTFNPGNVDAGRTAVLNRRRFAILIFGKGRLVNTLVGMLSAAGFSQLQVINRLPSKHPELKITERDVAGGYVGRGHVGQSRKKIISEMQSSAALFHNDRAHVTRADLVISIGTPAADALQRWVSEGTPHLLVDIPSSAEFRIGPLVIPGKTPCYRCVYLSERLDLLSNYAIESFELSVALSNMAASAILADVSQLAAGRESMFQATSLTYTMQNFYQPHLNTWEIQPGCGCMWG